MNIKNRFFLGLILVFSLSCQKKGDPKPGEVLTSEIEYKSKTVVMDEKADNAIVSVSKDNKTYVFKPEAFDKAPSVGETILIPGKLMRKVVSVKKVNNNYEIITSEAILTDVIQNGTIAFEITPEWGKEEFLIVNGQKARRVYESKDKVIEYTFKAEGIEYKIGIEPTLENGTISSCKFQMQMVKKSKGAPNVSLIGEGTMTLPKQNTNITIKDGKLDDFKSSNKGMSGTINLSISAADGEPGETTEVLPSIALSFPIRYLPTPYGPFPIPFR